MVVHLWGKFWMAAWRGRRAMTWITGVVAFLASIVECFTGYLSQQNFDSQWIATNGKDALNAMGVGAFFNVMNFGQMLMWHIVLVPIILVAIIGAHVVMVRVRGVSRPLAQARASAARLAGTTSSRKARFEPEPASGRTGANGSPPYIVRWLATGQIAMAVPGEFARVIPVSHPAGTARLG
jgi:quinol-cytochrome oxidoreductase complex cytochrome b subunit